MSSVTYANPITQPLYQARGAQSPGVYQRAAEIEAHLQAAECAALINAASPILFGSPDPYIPNDGPSEQTARWLASGLGLLVPASTGYITSYRPTLLGLCVVWCILVRHVSAMQTTQHGRQMQGGLNQMGRTPRGRR